MATRHPEIHHIAAQIVRRAVSHAIRKGADLDVPSTFASWEDTDRRHGTDSMERDEYRAQVAQALRQCGYDVRRAA